MSIIETFIDDIILIDNYAGLDTPLQSPFTYDSDFYNDEDIVHYDLSHKDLDIELDEYIGMEYLKKHAQLNINLLNEEVLSNILNKVYTNNSSIFGRLEISNYNDKNINYIINYSIIKTWIDCREDIYENIPIKNKYETVYIKIIFYVILYCKYNSEYYFEIIRKNFVELLKLNMLSDTIRLQINVEDFFKNILDEYDLTNTFVINNEDIKTPPFPGTHHFKTVDKNNLIKPKLKREDHSLINYNIRPITRSMTKKIKELI
jgi:hypothetical protein